MSQFPADRPAADDAALTQAWHEASRDEPALALDNAIRAAARQAVHARPRPAGGSPFGGRWRVPLSVAALVVVSATVTLLVAERDRHGTGALQDQAAPPPAAVRAPEAKTADTTDSLQPPARPFSEHVAPAPAAGVAPPRAESKRVAPPAPGERKVLAPPASPASTEQPQVRAQSDEQLARQTTGAAAPRAEADRPSPQPAQSDQATTARGAPAAAPPMTRSDAVSNVAGQTPAHEAVSGLAKREEQAAAKAKEHAAEAGPVSASTDASQRAQESSVPRAEPRSMRVAPAAKATAADAAASPEQSLDPKTWLDRILELRRLGKFDEAEKSLKAFRERYPAYPLPPELKSLP